MLLNLARRALALSLAPVLALVALVPAAGPASAAVTPTLISPGSGGNSPGVSTLGWSVVGLDSNRPLTDGPDEFPVGARYCAASPVADLTASWAWLAKGSTQNDSLIRLADTSTAYETITVFSTQTIGGQTCYDAYWNVKLTRSASAYDQDRGYQISFNGTGVPAGTSTNPLRRIYVEKLVSQNRNTVGSVTLDGGGETLTAGNTYDFTVTGKTSTSYDQLTFASIFPAPTFQLLDARYTYSTPGGSTDQTYTDACTWAYLYDKPSGTTIQPGYCTGVGGAGGNIVAHFTVRVSPTASGTVNINTLIYDFSGSSFHYNSDYGAGGKSFSFTIVPKANYTVTYWPNAGTDTVTGTVPDSSTVVQGGSHTVDTATISRTDGTTTYVFVGWNTNETGTGTAYKPGDVITPTGNVNLYAMWVPLQKWALAYNLQGGTGDATTDTTTIAVATPLPGESITVTGTTPTKTGYTFLGWNTKADGSGDTYTASSIVPNPGREMLVVLYAQWGPQERSVTYDPNDSDCSGTLVGGTWTDTSTLVSAPYTIKQVSYASIAYSCSGATFNGWNTASDGSGSSFPPGYVYTGTGPLTLYAQWSTLPTPSYIVTYLGNGATGGTQPVDTATYLTAETTTALANTFTRSGFTFSGWNTAANGSGTRYAAGATLTFATSDIVLYAQWNTTLTTAVVGSGSLTYGPGITTFAENTQVSLQATPAPGWSFAGWEGDCAGMGNPASITMNQARTCTAKFVELLYKLTVTTEGQGTATPGTNWYKDGTKVTLTATPAAGWIFTGWSGACTGTGACEVTMTMDKAVKATFVQGVVITTKTAGSGTVKSSQPTGTPLLPGTKVTLTAEPADGWKFTGWSGSCSGTDNPLTVTLDVSKDCTANFEELPKPVVEPLVAKNDTYRTTPGTPLRLPAGASILGNDGSTITRVQAVTKTKHGTITLAPNGKLVYTPKKGFVGVDSFKYRAFDANGRSVIATVKIIVAPKTPTDIKTGR